GLRRASSTPAGPGRSGSRRGRRASFDGGARGAGARFDGGGVAPAPPRFRPQPFSIALLSGVAARTGVIALCHFLVLRHRIVLEDFTLEDPDLDAAGTERRERGRNAVIDVGAQRVQRHPSLAV